MLFLRLTAAAAPLLPATASAAAPLGANQALNVAGGLALVLGLIVLTAWFARRMQTWHGAGQGRIKIVEGISVGTRDRLLLLDVEGKRVLVGISASGMHSLASFDAREDEAAFESALASASVEQLNGANAQ